MEGMRAALAALLVLLVAFPSVALARAWKRIEPGVSDKSAVLQAFGEPTARKTREGKASFRYSGEEVVDGHVVVVHFDEKHVVKELHVFPPRPVDIDKETIRGTYGKGFIEKLTDDLQVYWWYPKAGLVVFFDAKGKVDVFLFKEPDVAPEPKSKKK